MRQNVEALGTIMIPRSWQIPDLGFDYPLEVTPLDNKWLTSPERRWEEVDRFLEIRLKSIEESIQKTSSQSTIARSYGIENPISANHARLLSYIEILDEIRVVGDSNKDASQRLGNEYEEEKALIKRTTRSQGKIQKKLRGVRTNKYDPQLLIHSEKIENYQKITNLILKKTVLDLLSSSSTQTLSVKGSHFANFVQLVDEAKIGLDNTSSADEALRARRPVDYLLDSLARYLSNVNDLDLFNKYKYRESDDLVGTKKDTEILDALLVFVLDSQQLSSHPTTINQFENLGKASFKFIHKQALSSESVFSHDQYPNLALLYDIFSVALYRGRANIMGGLPDFIDSTMGTSVNNYQLKREITQLNNKQRRLYLLAHDDFIAHPLENYQDESSEISPMKELVLSPESRITFGFTVLATVANTEKAKKEKHSFLKQPRLLSDIAIKLWDAYKVAANDGIVLHDSFHVALTKMERDSVFSPRGIEMHLAALVTTSPLETLELPPRDQRGELLEKFTRRFKLLNGENFQQELLSRYLLLYWSEEYNNFRRWERENDYLWGEILNNPMWFVSPRGDRFRQRDDRELVGCGIDSITYSIDPAHPREHQAILRLTSVDRPLEFWLDSYRNVLGLNRRALLVDPLLRQGLTNVFLKRLYFISSGLLSSGSEQPGNGEEEGPSFEYRRAHYRHLISRPWLPITMESHGAKVHAQEILEIYGIDIFAEIRRRRAIGTLQANEFLTFVREVAPTFRSRLALPNELKFDPNAVQARLPVW